VRVSRRTYVILFGLLFLAYLGGLFLEIMEVDAAQYAEMSLEMLKSKSILQLYDGGVPYLDKPPLLMWLSSFSFYVFGVSDFAYRLPSFFGSILSVYCTFRLAKQWYNVTMANWAALILAACQAFFLFNHDVKTDNLLTSMAIFAIWQFSSYIRTRSSIHFISGFIGVGLAMLAKGPIGLVLPAAAIFGHLALQREWKKIFNAGWILGIPIVLMVLSPFLVGLYQQWGWHGIRFFFWTQSFGRITGESEWNNHSGAFYFVHTFLWAFIPWTICALVALFYSGKELVQSRFKLQSGQEGITISGFVLVFIALSMSRYKLPHYIFVLLPLAAIFTARWIYVLQEQKSKVYPWVKNIQVTIYFLLSASIVGILIYVFPPMYWPRPEFMFGTLNWFFWMFYYHIINIVVLMLLIGLSVAVFSRGAFGKIIAAGVICISAINIGLNNDFYPRLLKYQVSNSVGRELVKMNIPEDRFFFYGMAGCHSLNYYSHRINHQIYEPALHEELKKHDVWVYINEDDWKHIGNYPEVGNPYNVPLLKYPVQLLKPAFLNPATREKACDHMYLLHFEKLK